MIVAGIDEAGYGPMLGPLVVSAAIFRTVGPAQDEAAPPQDLWEALAPVVSREPAYGKVPVNDSKKLFQQGRGLRHLEEGVLPFLSLRHGEVARNLRALLRAVARRGRAAADRYLEDYPWYRGRDLRIPCDTFVPFVARLAEKLRLQLETARLQFLGLAAVPVEVIEFNRSLETWERKSRVSFQAIGWLLRRMWRQFPEEAVEIIVDRQGGRAHHAQLLFELVRPRGIRIESEGPDVSVYRLLRARPAGAAGFRVTFATESEEKCLAVALASMLSKYLRELHMSIFNVFWTERLGDLKPTAGYVLDARRFLAETEGLRNELRIDPALLVRRR